MGKCCFCLITDLALQPWYLAVIKKIVWIDQWSIVNYWLVVSNIFYFHPYLGKIPILTNTFQMGWNHQLVYLFQCLIHPLDPNWKRGDFHITPCAYILQDFWISSWLAGPSFINHLRFSHAKLLLFDSWFLNVDTFFLASFGAWHHRHQVGFGSG